MIPTLWPSDMDDFKVYSKGNSRLYVMHAGCVPALLSLLPLSVLLWQLCLRGFILVLAVELSLFCSKL